MLKFSLSLIIWNIDWKTSEQDCVPIIVDIVVMDFGNCDALYEEVWILYQIIKYIQFLWLYTIYMVKPGAEY